MSLKDLKFKSDQALASMPVGERTVEQRPVRPTTSPGAAAFMQPAMDSLNARAKAAEAKAAEYELKLAQQPVELALDDLVEVQSRKRRLTDEQFEDLKANLAANPLVHPIAVKKHGEGRFEIISGHNRVAAFRALGRSSIPVVLVDIQDEKVDRSSFYANLLQPSLPDFEKYLGFRRERDRTGHSQKAIAREAGISESAVSTLFSFEGLPAAALNAIEGNPDSIGMSCAAELVKLVREGRSERVVEAVLLLVDGKLSQKEAVIYASRSPAPASNKPAAMKPVKIRAGRAEFCRYVGRGSSLKIEFKDESARAMAEEGIAALLKGLAEQQDR